MATPEQNKQAVLEYFELLFNQRRIDEVVDCYHAVDYVQHNATVSDGPEALKAATGKLFAQFPDMRLDIKRAFAEGDYVIVHSEMSGVSLALDGTENIVANPRHHTLSRYALVDIVRLERGRIVEHWDVVQKIPATTADATPMV
ncbi:nuclear transport factor 2 family protein [Mycobacterium talmoniae]|uniref:SnoaL-like domain-containing protein n=1 Tax=Mycobacterium talmoniae TaxID=1858794 RepID=A0A1S1NKD3_9MYCO|nr:MULTISPECIES: ester cyclase [Mycobacterium]OHV04936.1 hypothetical protein BKN37_07805 [Mycobacterium talmoniae]PQM47453.1 hypothetical protein C1Y40_02376 [Mycobacterium talmoniae]TDH54203.1 hypothetical protein E2F47_11825 [Mycobacterium eburneum]